MMLALTWTEPRLVSPPPDKPSCVPGQRRRPRSFPIGEMMKKNLNHRGTENTEKSGNKNFSAMVFSVFSVPLWLISSVTAQPPIVGRPIDFSGAIGGPFVVTMEVESGARVVEVPVEEPFTLTLRIVGPGNLQE